LRARLVIDRRSYDLFAAHYFERRSHDLTIYENVSPTNPAARVITIVMRPQWNLYGPISGRATLAAEAVICLGQQLWHCMVITAA